MLLSPAALAASLDSATNVEPRVEKEVAEVELVAARERQVGADGAHVSRARRRRLQRSVESERMNRGAQADGADEPTLSAARHEPDGRTDARRGESVRAGGAGAAVPHGRCRGARARSRGRGLDLELGGQAGRKAIPEARARRRCRRRAACRGSNRWGWCSPGCLRRTSESRRCRAAKAERRRGTRGAAGCPSASVARRASASPRTPSSGRRRRRRCSCDARFDGVDVDLVRTGRDRTFPFVVADLHAVDGDRGFRIVGANDERTRERRRARARSADPSVRSPR